MLCQAETCLVTDIAVLTIGENLLSSPLTASQNWLHNERKSTNWFSGCYFEFSNREFMEEKISNYIFGEIKLYKKAQDQESRGMFYNIKL